MKVGDLVKHISYKDLIGLVFEVDLMYGGEEFVVVAWSDNRYGLGKNSVHHPDRLEVVVPEDTQAAVEDYVFWREAIEGVK